MSERTLTFHRYTDQELDAERPEPGECPYSDQGYLVVASSWAYGGGCGSESTGVWVFEHLLHALEYLAGFHDDLAEKHLKDYAAWRASVDAAIDQVRREHSDEGVDVGVAGFDANRVGLGVSTSGYWDDFVPEFLASIADDYASAAADEASDRETSGDDDNEDEDDEGPGWEEVHQWVARLRARTDIHSEAFIDAFSDVCSGYDEWVNCQSRPSVGRE